MRDEDRALIKELMRTGSLTIPNLVKAAAKEFLCRIAEILAVADEILMEDREPGRYERLGYEGRQLETLLGTVEFRRRRYRERGTGRPLYLVDEVLGLESGQRVSDEGAGRCHGVDPGAGGTPAPAPLPGPAGRGQRQPGRPPGPLPRPGRGAQGLRPPA
ncbi:MAG: UPF0236 family protein [Acetobacteraceae bacterium]|nr:UPF0236 family protein [Acetobacteraceae bacterium]